MIEERCSTFVLLWELDSFLDRCRRRRSLSTRCFNERTFPTRRPWTVGLTMRNDVGFDLILNNLEQRLGSIAKFSCDNKGEIVGNVVTAVIFPD